MPTTRSGTRGAGAAPVYPGLEIHRGLAPPRAPRAPAGMCFAFGAYLTILALSPPTHSRPHAFTLAVSPIADTKVTGPAAPTPAAAAPPAGQATTTTTTTAPAAPAARAKGRKAARGRGKGRKVSQLLPIHLPMLRTP